MDAYDTDVRPLLADLRRDMGLDPEPMAAYARSGHAAKIAADRVGGSKGTALKNQPSGGASIMPSACR